jgi:4a-hydroxytetrahydrobiopterin dehydratase
MLLPREEIKQKLSALKGWELTNKQIHKTFVLKDFAGALKLVNRIAFLAEADNHHPDININYNKVTFTLSTHSEGGVTEKDLALAEKIETEASI